MLELSSAEKNSVFTIDLFHEMAEYGGGGRRIRGFEGCYQGQEFQADMTEFSTTVILALKHMLTMITLTCHGDPQISEKKQTNSSGRDSGIGSIAVKSRGLGRPLRPYRISARLHVICVWQFVSRTMS